MQHARSILSLSFFIFFVAYSFNSIEAYTQKDYSVSVAPDSSKQENITVINTETITNTRYTVLTNDGYIVEVECWIDRLMGDCSHKEKYINNEPNSSTIESTSQNTAPNSSILSHDHMEDHIYDWSVDAHRQANDENKIGYNETTEKKNEYKPTNQKIIHESNLPKRTIIRFNKEQTSRLDSTLILEKVRTDHELTNALISSIIQARFQRIKYTIRKTPRARGTRRIKKAKLKTLDALISGRIAQLIKQKQHSDLNVAQTAFNELKNYGIGSVNTPF